MVLVKQLEVAITGEIYVSVPFIGLFRDWFSVRFRNNFHLKWLDRVFERRYLSTFVEAARPTFHLSPDFDRLALLAIFFYNVFFVLIVWIILRDNFFYFSRLQARKK